MISSLFAVYSAINGSYHSASLMFGASQQKINLANNVNPEMTPAETKSLMGMEKALDLQSVHAKVMFAAYQAMQQGATQQLKKELELQKRLNQIWYS